MKESDVPLAVAKRRLKDALERRQRAKPGTPAWYRAAEDIKRGDREVARLTENNGGSMRSHKWVCDAGSGDWAYAVVAGDEWIDATARVGRKKDGSWWWGLPAVFKGPYRTGLEPSRYLAKCAAIQALKFHKKGEDNG